MTGLAASVDPAASLPSPRTAHRSNGIGAPQMVPFGEHSIFVFSHADGRSSTPRHRRPARAGNVHCETWRRGRSPTSTDTSTAGRTLCVEPSHEGGAVMHHRLVSIARQGGVPPAALGSASAASAHRPRSGLHRTCRPAGVPGGSAARPAAADPTVRSTQHRRRRRSRRRGRATGDVRVRRRDPALVSTFDGCANHRLGYRAE